MGYINLNESVRYLKGVGPKNVVKFEKMGINTIHDLIEHYPRSYEDRRKLKKINEFINGEHVVFIAKIVRPIKEKRIRKSLNIMFFYVSDSTEECQITIFNQAYLKDKLVLGNSYAFYGKVEITNGRFEMQNPIIVPDFEVDKIMGIYPIYSLTQGITNNYIYNLTKSVLDSGVVLPETIDADIRRKCNLVELNYAVNTIHSPNDFRTIEYARRRIIFEELFFLQLALQSIKKRNVTEAHGICFKDTDYTEFSNLLPFNLTGAQVRAIDEIRQDMQSTTPMNRLVQGDVGSGKTMVAAIAMYIAVKNGYQTAMMAPTAILAIQHKEELSKYFEKLNIRVEVITSSTTAKCKKQIIQDLKEGKINILIGTHAIIEDNIEFKNLGIIITDEQHRFGVKQRMKLSEKGDNVDVIVMTATPIPRTLALMVYSDLDMSIIDELPPGRKPIKTFVIDDSFEERIITFIKKELDKGRQAYIVCPLIEENETLDLKDATTLYENFKTKYLTEYGVGFLNGKMKSKEKDEVMRQFKEGTIQLIISTTVIEVGVNVPNATLMIIENADRFGLAALHQLRGRVGRSSYESYCVLKTNNKSVECRERLGIMTKSNDGFEIAQKDLELRGPGDFFGVRQHGLPEFKMADLLKDMKILKESNEAAKTLLKEDPTLNSHVLIKHNLHNKYKEQLHNIGT